MKYLVFICSLLVSISCTKISEVEENPLLFFWQEMDKRYVYFDEKKLDWDSVRISLDSYNPGNSLELMSGFKNLIHAVNDEHVWVDTHYEIITPLLEDYYNFSSIELEKYSPSNIVNTENYRIVQLVNDIVFIEIKHFEQPFNDFTSILKEYQFQNGIILDVKNCRGGYLDYAFELASYFICGRHTVLYQKFKKGHGHYDFTDYHPLKLDGNGFVNNVKIITITDLATYSTANMFVSIMKNFSGAVQVGNQTGGGGASSIIGILPNGWIYSISENPHFDVSYISLESGLMPEHYVAFGKKEFDEYRTNKVHSQMEYAFNLLND